MSGDPIYYLRAIARRLQELHKIAGAKSQRQFGLADQALADEILWLDCYIETLECRHIDNLGREP